MVMQRARPVVAYNTGAMQMQSPAAASTVSAGLQGNIGVGGSGVGLVLAVALGLVIAFYIATRGIQGSR